MKEMKQSVKAELHTSASADGYLGITRPLTYPARQNGQLMAKMIFGVWLVSASITLPPFCGWAKNINTEGVCLISQDFSYTIYSTAVAFYIPMLVMLFMYYKIFKAARKSGAKHRFTSIVRSLDPPASELHCKNEAVRMQGLKPQHHGTGVAEECAALSRLLSPERQNMSIFKREQKAATTLGVIVGVFSICWLPFFILTTARPFICGVECSCIPIWLERMLLWFGYANSLVNPFIYAFFNRDLRSTYRDLLRCRYRNINRRLSAVGVHEALKSERSSSAQQADTQSVSERLLTESPDGNRKGWWIIVATSEQLTEAKSSTEPQKRRKLLPQFRNPETTFLTITTARMTERDVESLCHE
ncbi:hypothetical protein AOLI_G00282690 [Acnodon oligacanthus]